MSALKQILSKKTDAELVFYIENVDKHTDEAVRLAFAELQSRNFVLPENASEKMEEQLTERTVKVEDGKKNPWTKNVVEDSDAPMYYSQSAINIFSILFSVFFGSFMLAANCKDAGRKQWPVLLFGFLYTGVALMVLLQFSRNVMSTYIANSVGVLLMYELFWKRYIGNDTKYRSKPIWKPLIIGLIIFIPVIIFMINHTPS